MKAYNLLFAAIFLSGFSAQAQLKMPKKTAEQQQTSNEEQSLLPLKPGVKLEGSNVTTSDSHVVTETLENTEKSQEQISADFEKKAIAQVQEMIESRLETIRAKANNTASADKRNIKGYVLSDHIKDFPDISPKTNIEIKELKQSVKKLINIAATVIELQSSKVKVFNLDDSGQLIYTKNPDLSDKRNHTRELLLKANLKNNISTRSAALSVKLLVNINDNLVKLAENEKNQSKKESLYTTQAIQFYEMSDIVLSLLDELKLGGEESIFNLYSAEKVSTTDRIAEINTQIKRAQELQASGMMNEEQLKAEVADYKKLTQSNIERLTIWDTLLENIAKQSAFIETIKRNKNMLIYKRDKAKLQLTTLRDLRGTSELQNAIGSLKVLTEVLEPLELSTLDDTTIQSLLGYSAGL